METICLTYQILFSGNKKNIISLSSAEFAQRVGMVDNFVNLIASAKQNLSGRKVHPKDLNQTVTCKAIKWFCF